MCAETVVDVGACVCPVLGHILGELHEVFSFLHWQQRQDPAVAVHALLLLAHTHVEVGAFPQVADVGGVILNGWNRENKHPAK